MRWFNRLYGSNPLHLLVSIACLVVAVYAADLLVKGGDVKGLVIWLAVAIIGHDLVLFPLYAIADRSIRGALTHRPPTLPKVPWINHLRVPVVISAILFGMWWPLMFNIPPEYTQKTDLPSDVYLGRWLMVTAALFILSAVAFALKLAMGVGRGSGGKGSGRNRETAADPISALSGPMPADQFGADNGYGDTRGMGSFGDTSSSGFGSYGGGGGSLLG